VVERLEGEHVGRRIRPLIGIEVVEEDRGSLIRGDERGVSRPIAVALAPARHEAPERRFRLAWIACVRETGRDPADRNGFFRVPQYARVLDERGDAPRTEPRLEEVGWRERPVEPFERHVRKPDP
jgi:hypothetical protein